MVNIESVNFVQGRERMTYNNRYEYTKDAMTKGASDEEEQSLLRGVDKITNNAVVFKKRRYQGLGFSTEREILKLLQHENLPTLIDAYTKTDEEVLVLLHFEGDTLSEVSHSKQIREAQLILIFNQLCNVVEYLHTHPKGIVHRDITPANIMVNDRGHVLLIDFDASTCDAFLNSTSEVYGTIEYVAPETLLHTEMSGRLSDIYGIGACLWSCLKENKEIYSLELTLIAKKAMALIPADRYKNIKQLKEDLQLLL